jgi:hypothetical protein
MNAVHHLASIPKIMDFLETGPVSNVRRSGAEMSLRTSSVIGGWLFLSGSEWASFASVD